MTEFDDAADMEWFRRTFGRLAKSLAVSALYFISLLIFGAAFWKCVIVVVVLTLLQTLSLGSRRIAQFGLVMLLVAGMFWLEIMPLHRWAKLSGDRIEAFLQPPANQSIR